MSIQYLLILMSVPSRAERTREVAALCSTRFASSTCHPELAIEKENLTARVSQRRLTPQHFLQLLVPCYLDEGLPFRIRPRVRLRVEPPRGEWKR